jgi:type III pantothenate kinase
MFLLAIDIGNTNIVFGVHDSEKWLNHWRIQTDPLKTADEYEVIFRSLLQADKIREAEISEIIVSSVVPSLIYPFSEMANDLFSEARVTVVNPDIYNMLPIKVLNPYQIGTDLVSNSVAAFQKYGILTMVVDFGTAMTFTTIGSDSEILGVAIAPGLNTAMGSLAGKTAQLPHVHLVAPPSVLGKNTIHAIQAGIVYGFAGLVDAVIDKTQSELGKKLNIVATGGLSSVIAPLTKNIKIIEIMLTLDGLHYINRFVNHRQ